MRDANRDRTVKDRVGLITFGNNATFWTKPGLGWDYCYWPLGFDTCDAGYEGAFDTLMGSPVSGLLAMDDPDRSTLGRKRDEAKTCLASASPEWTNITSGLEMARREFDRDGDDVLDEARGYRVLLLSDGMHNAAGCDDPHDPLTEPLVYINANGPLFGANPNTGNIRISAVNIHDPTDGYQNDALVQQLAKATGGGSTQDDYYTVFGGADDAVSTDLAQVYAHMAEKLVGMKPLARWDDETSGPTRPGAGW